jgi:hypothetical protein
MAPKPVALAIVVVAVIPAHAHNPISLPRVQQALRSWMDMIFQV